jgi:hypothetical protein
MKPFLPFLLVPLLALGGWGLSALAPAPAVLTVPSVLTLNAPPPLGVALPPPPSDGPVYVSLQALLPMTPSQTVELATQQPLPEVTAILMTGVQRMAQVNGQPMVIGERLGDFRLAEIEADQVMFVQTSLDTQRWVRLLDR